MLKSLVLLSGCGLAAAVRPQPPPPPAAAAVLFNATFSDYAALQAMGENNTKSAVYGTAPPDAALTITVASAAGDASYSVKATASAAGQWKAYLNPAADGGDATITAHCASGCTNSTDAVLEHVTFGDVWYCAGQSNMWLPMSFTYSRNYTVANITAGKYSNIRLMAGDSQHGRAYPWKTAKDATICHNGTKTPSGVPDGRVIPCDYNGPPLFRFSAACWYFAEALTDEFVKAGKTPPTIGLINTAIGGSMIEEWSLNTTLATCKNTSDIGKGQQSLWDANVVPYLSMTVRGFLWYQGENNMHALKGHVDTGYSCMMPAMIAQWRKIWSAEPHTTPSDAPFGLVVLPDSGGEGGANMGAMRLAQTGSFGVLPNEAMPNTFLAQAFDLDDPWGSKNCYGMGCCNQWEGPGVAAGCVAAGCDKPGCTNNASTSAPGVCNATACGRLRCPAPFNNSRCASAAAAKHLPVNTCDEYCRILHTTPVYMGGIHPRLKRPVGERLATAAYNLVYGGTGEITGPTIAGCSATGSKLTVSFDATLLRGGKLVVQPNATAHPTMLQVLFNSSLFCIEPLLASRNVSCPPAPNGCKGKSWTMHTFYHCPLGAAITATMREAHESLLQEHVASTGHPPACPYQDAWQTVLPTAGAAPGTIDIDLSAVSKGAAPVGVRYAMDGNCCDDTNPAIGSGLPCPAQACPLMSSDQLPANPFQAHIVSGKCQCVAPQKCDL